MDQQSDSSTTSPDETQGAPLLSVVIPVFNEVRTIDRLLAAVRSVELDAEIIVEDVVLLDAEPVLIEVTEA